MSSFIKEHKRGIAGTLLFHIALAIVFAMVGFTTPLPLPGEEGILINFGDMEEAAGPVEPKTAEAVQEATPEPQEQEQTVSEETPVEESPVLTQDYEDAPVEETKQEEQTEEVKEEAKEQTEQQEEKEQEERKVNVNALYTGRNKDNNSTGSEGVTSGEGNQGSETGSVDSDNYTGGESMGNNGINFSLAGRNPESLPLPEYNYQLEGKVVVEITVDKYGNVTKAEPGKKGSTTLDDKLLQAAKRAALKAKFDRKPDAPAYQKGTITYYFKLQ